MPRILCVGIATLDFVFSLDSLPSGPRKFVAHDTQTVGGGGGANAATAIARLGGAAVLATRVGDDPTGAMILEGLAAEGVDTSHVSPAPGTRSSWSSVCIDAAGERQIVNYRGSGPDLVTAWFDDLTDIDAVVTDTRQPKAALAALDLARRLGVPGIVDGEAPIATDILAAASHVAFPVQGLRSLAPEGPAEQALDTLARRYGIWAAVTDGAEGVWHSGPRGVLHTPAFPVEAVDTLGAGDVWHGAFALALAEGQSESDAVRFASAAAALKCTRPGGRAGFPTRAEVDGLMRTTPS